MELWKYSKHSDLNRESSLIAKEIARSELFRRTVELPGEIIECGILNGGGLFFWAKLINIFCPNSNKKVIGFDSFENSYADESKILESEKINVNNINNINSGRRKYSPKELLDFAKDMRILDNVIIEVGDASEKIKEFCKKNNGIRISLLNIDFGLYKPSYYALKYLYPLVVKGGIIILDEYGRKGWGESDAVNDTFNDTPPLINSFSWTSSPGGFIVK